MSPRPVITPAPALPARLDPRQYNSDDPYGLASLDAYISSLLNDYTGFDYSQYYASYLSQYNPYNTKPGYNALSSATRGSYSNPTNGALVSSQSNTSSSGGGLSSGAKIGIAVAVPVALLLLAGVGVFLWCAGKRKGKKTATTIVAPNVAQTPAPPQFQPQPQVYPPNQGYMQGYQQPPPQFAQTPPPQFAQVPPQYSPGQNAGQLANQGYYAKGPPEGVVEMETEYHFARGGAVEIGDTEPKEPEKKGPSWRKLVGSGNR